jgi:hypothetical protein
MQGAASQWFPFAAAAGGKLASDACQNTEESGKERFLTASQFRIAHSSNIQKYRLYGGGMF